MDHEFHTAIFTKVMIDKEGKKHYHRRENILFYFICVIKDIAMKYR